MMSKETTGRKLFGQGADQMLRALIEENMRQQACIERMEQELKCLPAGGLCFKNVSGKLRPYHQIWIDGRRVQKSIAARQDLVEALARKRIIQNTLTDLKGNVKALSACIKQYRPLQTEATIAALPEPYKEIRHRCFLLLGKPDIDAWMAEPFPQNPYYEERRIHLTLRGELVRSKSEMTLANLLYGAGTPYRYEAQLLLNGREYYPDFTILHPVTGRLFYWEHFGMTGDRDYMIKADSKISIYREQGIVPWQNFIVTYDTPEGTLDVQMAQCIVNLFFR